MSTPLLGLWRYNNGIFCCGNLRIAVQSFDTNPSDECKKEIFDWICKTLNEAQEKDSDNTSHNKSMDAICQHLIKNDFGHNQCGKHHHA